MKLILLYILLSISLSAQVVIRSPELTIQSKDLGTFAQNVTAGTDSVSLTVNTRRVTIDSMKTPTGVEAEIYDSTLVYGDTLWGFFTYDKSVVGTYIDYWYVYHTGYGSPDTSTITYTIAVSYDLIVENTLDFDTVNTASNDYLTISNISEAPIINITYSGLASPFAISNTITTLSNEDEHDLLITFNAISNGTYNDTLIITSSATNSPVSVPISGVWQADTIPSTAQWIAASPGGGGWWQGAKIDPVSGRYHIVGDLGGHFYSDDGFSWETSSGVLSYEIGDIEILPGGDTVLLATAGGIYRSLDGGENFTREGVGEIYPAIEYTSDASGDTIAYGIGAINYHPANSQVIYAGTGWAHSTERTGPEPCKIYKSTDGGATWGNFSTGIQSSVNSVGGFSGSENSVDTVYVVTREGLYRTANGGTSWTRINTRSSLKPVMVDPTNASNVWIATGYSSNYVGYSTNAGASFTDVYSNISSSLGINVRVKEIILSATGDTVFLANDYESTDIIYSTNNGNTWSTWSTITSNLRWNTYANGSRASAGASYMDISDDYQTILVVDDMMAYLSTNGGSTWINSTSNEVETDYFASRGPEILVGHGLAINPDNNNTIYANYTDVGLVVSHDAGYTWKHIRNQMANGHGVAIDPSDTNYIYYGAGVAANTDPSVLYRSSDGGATWITLDDQPGYDLPENNYKNLFVSSTGRVFALSAYAAYGNDGMYYSDDNGINWTLANGSKYWTDMIEVDGTLYATKEDRGTGTSSGLIYSTNDGTSWSGIDHDSLGYVQSVAVHPTNSDIIYFCQGDRGQLASGKPAGVYKTSNGGTTFTQVYTTALVANDRALFSHIRIDPSNSNTIYVSTSKDAWRMDYGACEGMLMSTDAGVTWESIDYGLERAISKFEVSNDGWIFGIGPGTGGWKLDKITPQSPTITNFIASGDGINQEIDLTTSFTSSGSNEYAYADIRTDSTALFDGADDNYVMSISGNQAAYTFSSVDTSQTYYLQSIVGNNIGRDTSNIESVEFNTTSSIVDTFYTTTTWDDVYRQYSALLAGTYNYFNMGYSSGDIKAGVRFGGINNFYSIDSAKIEFTAYYNAVAEIDMTIFGEDTQSPLVFSNYTDFDNRLTNLTTDSSTALEGYSTAWTDGSKYLLDVTDIVIELMGSYSYSSGNMCFIIKPKIGHSMTSTTRSPSGHEFDSGSEKPKLIIWGTQ